MRSSPEMFFKDGWYWMYLCAWWCFDSVPQCTVSHPVDDNVDAGGGGDWVGVGGVGLGSIFHLEGRLKVDVGGDGIDVD